jgi:hypothetical protein
MSDWTIFFKKNISKTTFRVASPSGNAGWLARHDVAHRQDDPAPAEGGFRQLTVIGQV